MVVLGEFLTPEEGILHEEKDTTVYVNQKEVGKGTLYITESVLSWVNTNTRQGFSLEYPHISIHAISRDERAHPRQCLYVMVDAKVDFPESLNVELNHDSNHDHDSNRSADANASDDDDDSDASITEMRFAPDDINNLDAMFQAMNQCQALHPDPQDSFSDAEDEIFEDAEADDFEYYEGGAIPYIMPGEHVEASQNGTEVEEAMDVEAGQFEDAEEDP